jgi:hypothetical protein
MLGGKFYGSNIFYKATRDYSIDSATGVKSAFPVSITGMPDGYFTNANYIAGTDTLYVWNDSNLYKATGVAAALGQTTVPEPANWALMVGSFAMLSAALRVQRRTITV